MIEKAIISILESDAGIIGQIGTPRVVHVPADQPRPYAVVQRMTMDPEEAQGADAGMVTVYQYQIRVCALTVLTGIEISDQIVTLIESSSGTHAGVRVQEMWQIDQYTEREDEQGVDEVVTVYQARVLR